MEICLSHVNLFSRCLPVPIFFAYSYTPYLSLSFINILVHVAGFPVYGPANTTKGRWSLLVGRCTTAGPVILSKQWEAITRLQTLNSHRPVIYASKRAQTWTEGKQYMYQAYCSMYVYQEGAVDGEVQHLMGAWHKLWSELCPPSVVNSHTCNEAL